MVLLLALKRGLKLPKKRNITEKSEASDTKGTSDFLFAEGEMYMHMPEKTFSTGHPDIPCEPDDSVNDVLFSNAVNDLAHVYGVTSQDDLDELVFQVVNSLQHLKPDFQPSEEGLSCVRERLERTAGLLSCEKSVALEMNTEPIGQHHKPVSVIPC